MAIGYNTKIAANGLVFCVDPANVKSYPGSGTTLTDLTGNRDNATLTNGPTYDSANGGSIVFDGTDEYITDGNTDFSIANNLFADANGAFTVSAWFKFPITPAGTRAGNQSWAIVGRAGGIATGGTFVLYIGSETDTTYGNYAPYKCACTVRGTVTIISSNSANDNIWHTASVTWDGTAGKVYFDGVETATLDTSIGAGLQTTSFFIGNVGATPANQAFEGNISHVAIYNRSLSAEEIFQNFNAIRGRYGV